MGWRQSENPEKHIQDSNSIDQANSFSFFTAAVLGIRSCFRWFHFLEDNESFGHGKGRLFRRRSIP